MASLIVCCLALFYLAEPSDFYRFIFNKGQEPLIAEAKELI